MAEDVFVRDMSEKGQLGYIKLLQQVHDENLPLWSHPVLPLLRSPHGAIKCDLPSVKRRFDRYPRDRLRLLNALCDMVDKPVSVLSVSLGTFPHEYDADEPLFIAIHHLTHQGKTVVVAAGNDGPDEGTLSGLAESPDVISVGGTDADGQLLEISSRGSPGHTGPTLVSPGRSLYDATADPCTSWATAQVAGLAATLIGRFQLLEYLRAGVGEQVLPCPVPIVVVLDDAGPTHLRQVQRRHTDLLIPDRWFRWFQDVSLVPLLADCEPEHFASPSMIRNALRSIATQVPGRAEWEVGSGAVTKESVVQLLSRFTPSAFLSACAGHDVADRHLRRLDKTLGPLWSPSDVMTLSFSIEFFEEDPLHIRAVT